MNSGNKNKPNEISKHTAVQNKPVKRTKTVVKREQYFTGPIPPPAILAEYNAIIPDAADRILKMAEKQSAHRIKMEGTVVHGNETRANRGQWIAGLLLFASIVASVILKGNPWGVTIPIIPSGTLFIAFAVGKIQNRKERQEKRARKGV